MMIMMSSMMIVVVGYHHSYHSMYRQKMIKRSSLNYHHHHYEHDELLMLPTRKENRGYYHHHHNHPRTYIAPLLVQQSFNNNDNDDIIALKENKDKDKYNELMKCLRREYTSFFSPMEKRFYSQDVQFVDPLNEFQGINKYQNNVDLLAGRTRLGSLLFTDASIAMHSVRIVNVGDVINGVTSSIGSGDDMRIETRWTLQVTAKSLPWKPRARFTGISLYTLAKNGIIVKQEVWYHYDAAIELLYYMLYHGV